MSKVLVITNAAHDNTTNYLSVWSDKALRTASSHGVELFELNGKSATRSDLEQMIAERNPQAVTLHGHGNSSCVTGYEQEVLVQEGDNEAILSDRIVHTLSCESGRSLGPRCIACGTKAYIGYTEAFKFFHLNKSSETEKGQDHVAALFLDPAFMVLASLIEGNTAKEAFDKSQQLFRDNLLAVITTGDRGLASYLYHDLKCQVLLGDESSVISDRG